MDTKTSRKMGDESDEDVVYLGEVRAGEEDSGLEYINEVDEFSSEDEDEIVITSRTTYRSSFQALPDGYIPISTSRTTYHASVAQAQPGSLPNAEITIPEFQLIPLGPSDWEFLYVYDRMNEFQQSPITLNPMQFCYLQILKVEKVWNTKLFSRYLQHVQRIVDETQNGPNETLLFHGSTKCLEIVQKGFDERLASRHGIFGAGVYFAEHSFKSGNYSRCGHLGCMQCPRRMLLCRVALGNVYQCPGTEQFAHAPPDHHSVLGFVQVGNVIYPEYVVYRGEQAYPEYLITYKIA